MAALEETLKKNGILVYTNKGDSMMPLLRENKDLMIIRTLTEPPKKSDAVLFKRPNGALVLHRIVKANKDGSYMIVGDNRVRAEKVPGDWIIGILTGVIRDGKEISVTDKEYLDYLKSVPKRRAKLFFTYYYNAVKRKLGLARRR